MAGVTDITKAPYPTGGESTVAVRIGGYVPASAGADYIIESWLVPWDCEVFGVNRSLDSPGNTYPDDIKLATLDDTKTIVATLANASAAIAGIAQSLHADIVGYQIQKGDVIQLKADTEAGEDANIVDTLLLRPKYPG